MAWYERADDAEIVEALCDVDEGLSEWEVEFVDSLAKWLKDRGPLTEKQRAKAEQILSKLER